MRRALSAIALLALALAGPAEARRIGQRRWPGGAQRPLVDARYYVAPDDATENWITTGGRADIVNSSGAKTLAWSMRCAAAPGIGTVILGNEPGGQVRIDFTAGENLRIVWYVGGGATRRCRYTTDRITVGRWQRFVFRFDPARDPGSGGQDVRNQAMADAWIDEMGADFDSCVGTPTTDAMNIAASGLGEFHVNAQIGLGATGAANCEYQEVMLFDRALSGTAPAAGVQADGQIAKLFRLGFDPRNIPGHRLWAFARVADGTGSAADLTGRGNTLTAAGLEAADVGLGDDGRIWFPGLAALQRLVANGGNALKSNGQSLIMGTNGAPPLNNVSTFANVLGAWTGIAWPLLLEGTAPPTVDGVETHQTAMANHLRNVMGASYGFVASSHGGGGTQIIDHIAGGDRFNALVASVTSDYAQRAGLAGAAYQVVAVPWKQGEANESAGTPVASYTADLLTIPSAYTAAIRAITGQTGNVPLIVSQLSSSTAVGTGSNTANIGWAQFLASLSAPNSVIMLGPSYGPLYPYSGDAVHMSNAGYEALGDYFGEALRRILVPATGGTVGVQWRGLAPRRAEASGSTVRVCYYVPCQQTGTCTGGVQLVLDTGAITCPANSRGSATCLHGYELVDPNPQPRYLTSVAVDAATNCVVLTANAAIQAGSSFTYAYSGVVGAASGVGTGTSQGSHRGTLRDASSTTGWGTGAALVNYGVHHGPYAISGGAAPSASVATLIDDEQWPFRWTSDNCPSAGGAWSGTFSMPYAAGSGTHSCGNSTPGSGVATIFGSARANAAMDGTDGASGTSASAWRQTGTGNVQMTEGASDDFAFGYWGELAMADSGHGIVRLMTRREDTTNRDYYVQIAASPTNQITFVAQTNTAVTVTMNWSPSPALPASGSPTPSVLHVLLKKTGWSSTTPGCIAVLCWNGQCTTGGAGSACGGWGASGGNLSLGANQGGSNTNYWRYVGYGFAIGQAALAGRASSPAAFIAWHQAEFARCQAAGYCQ